jgi:DNA-binding CsgD family transcriptional regulator
MDRPLAGSWPLTGREVELDSLSTALAGSAQIVLVHGPGGMGKSRFLTEIAEQAVADGAYVLHLVGNAVLAAIPLGVLSSHLLDIDLYDGSAPDPARLFAEAGAAFRREADGRPVVMVVDDITLFDSASVLLVAQLAAAGRVRLVAGIRYGDPVPEALVAAWSAARDVRIDLGPLSPEAVRNLLESVLGRVAHRTAAALHEATGGNPLYLREVVHASVADGSLCAKDGVWQVAGGLGPTPTVTPALRDLVLARIAHLDRTSRDVLERLAVCGALRPDQLARGLPDNPGTGQVRRLLADLEQTGLIRATHDTVRLTHPVYATALTRSLPRLRVQDILTEQARVIAGQRDETPDLLQVTTWQLEAGISADPEVLVTAAQHATLAGDHGVALRLAAAGLEAAPEHPELLLVHAEALLRSGRTDEALASLGRHHLSRVADTHAARGAGATDAPGLDENALRPVLLSAMALLTGRGPLAAVEALDKMVGDTPTPSPALALVRAIVLLPACRVTDAVAAVRDAEALMGDSEVEQAILAHARAIPLACMGLEAEGLEAAERAVAMAEATGGRVPGLGLAEMLMTLGTVQQLTGRSSDARTTGVRALVAATERDDEVLARCVEYLLGRVAVDAGDLPAAERWLGETLSGALTVGPPGLAALARLSLVMTHALAAAPEQAGGVLAEIPRHEVAAPVLALAESWSDAAQGHEAAALRRIEDVVDDALRGGYVLLAAAAWQLAIELDRPDFSAAPLRLAADGADSTFLTLLADHAEAAARDDVAALSIVADAWETRGNLRLAAAACARGARAAGQTRSGTALRARAADLVRGCGGLDTPAVRQDDATDPVSPLTRREREIAGLAAEGATSKEIAARLFVSSRTVDNHLQAVYSKLGIRGRPELRAGLRLEPTAR